ncbi:MAG: insulinase family protein [Bacteroidales bacterium]|nr:insulinase family protein [Bacteroidales bacterium]
MITGKTASGLQYALRRKDSSSVAYCSISIKAGTRDEKGYPKGIAHFVEHTIFKGTSTKSASVVNSYLDRLGGELNAYTTKEEIVLHATVLLEDLAKASSLLFELATDSQFPEKEIEKEKGVVIEEISSYKDCPADDIYDRFESLLFARHPLSGLILGTPSSVSSITRDDLLRFTKEKFVPANMVFSVVADLDEAEMEKKVKDLDTKFFGAASPAPEPRKLRRKASGAVFDRTINKRNHQANCVIGGFAPSLYDEDRIAAVLLSNILGGPAANSILNDVLREKHGWVYGVECAYTQYADSGIITISLGCDKDDLDKCLRAVDRELGKLREAPLSSRRLAAAKKQLLGQLAISGESGEAQCLSMGKSMLSYGKVNSSEENIALVNSITPEAIQKAARELLAPDHLSKLVYL